MCISLLVHIAKYSMMFLFLRFVRYGILTQKIFPKISHSFYLNLFFSWLRKANPVCSKFVGMCVSFLPVFNWYCKISISKRMLPSPQYTHMWACSWVCRNGVHILNCMGHWYCPLWNNIITTSIHWTLSMC